MSVASQSTRPPGGGAQGDAEFDLPALGAALWRSKWKILGPTLIVALMALGVVQAITPRYLSESRVLIEGRDNVFLRPDADKDIADRTAVDDATVTSQVQLILSRDLARAVIAKLGLGKRSEFDPALSGVSTIRVLLGRFGLVRDPMRMTPEERVLESYYDRLTVYAVDKSRVIVVDFLSQDSELAAKIANAIADEYLLRQRAAKQEQASIAVQWLSGEIQSMQKKVAEAEAKVAAFRANTNLLQGPNNTTLSAQQLGDVNTQLATARAQEADAAAKVKIIHEMLRSGRPIDSSDVLNSELIRRLSEQRVTLRAELAEQSSSLGNRHPRIKELRAQIADLDQQIRAEAESIARSFENDARIASARVDSLTANFDQAKNQAAAVNERDVELRALERDAKSQRDLLESYLAKYREATARDTLNSSPADARVFSRATASNVPAYPKKLPSVLVAALATMMLCVGFVLTRELLRVPPAAAPAPRDQTPAVEAETPPPALRAAAAPVATAVPRGARTAAAAPRSSIADVAETLRDAGGSARIAVLAAAPDVPTGQAAIALARALAAWARVILVSLDPEPSAAAAIGADASEPGLAELAAGTASMRNIIVKDRLSAAHVISSGRTAMERMVLLSSPRIAPNFEALAACYDYVVVDGGIAEGVDLEAIGEIAPHAVLLAAAASDAEIRAARERLAAAEFGGVTIVAAADAAQAGVEAAAA